MNALILDIYRKSNYRISKDTCGGYGTENDFGSGFIPQALSRAAKFSLFWPPLAALNLLSELLASGMNARYTKKLTDINDQVDYIFLSTSIVSFDEEFNAATYIRKKFPRIKIYAFGSILNIATIKYRSIGVAVLVGEPEFLPQIHKLNAPNLNLINELGVVNIPSGDPDLLAAPLWVADKNCRSINVLFGGYKGYIPYLASRGCPYSCYEYCTYPIQQGRKVRHTNPTKVVEDLKYINANFGSSHFVFRDPVFSINKRKTGLLLEELAKLDGGYSFTIETHLHDVDDEMARRLVDGKVAWVKFGVESSSMEVKTAVDRYSLENDDQEFRVEICKNNKLKTVAMYILCQPADTLETCGATIDYSIKLKTNLAQYSLFTPYPGTPFYEKLDKDLLIAATYDDYTQYKMVYKHEIFSPEKAREMLGFAYSKYYSRKLIPGFIEK